MRLKISSKEIQANYDVILIGGGFSNLVLAQRLCHNKGLKIALFEHKKTVGRKYLVAGKGGFNLSNRVTAEALVSYYRPSGFLDQALSNYDVDHLVDWYKDLGIETFVGSSNRIFPEEKHDPIDVLNALRKPIESSDIQVYNEAEFISFTNTGILISSDNMIYEIQAKHCVFALGGASWSVTGSTGTWTKAFEDIDTPIESFAASNVGLKIAWNPNLKNQYAGHPIKNIALKLDDNTTKLGEMMLSEYGVEGQLIYPVSHSFTHDENKKLILDLKPQWTLEKLIYRLDRKMGNVANRLKKNGLSKACIAMIKSHVSKETWMNTAQLAATIKHFSLDVQGTSEIEEAISTRGGIPVSALNENFELHHREGVYCIGEMVDWDAPTGGFLLQACYSMANHLAKHIEKSLQVSTE